MLPRLDRPCPLTAVLAAESNKRRPLLSKLTFTAVTNARSGRSTIQHIQVATNRLTVRRPQYTEHLRSERLGQEGVPKAKFHYASCFGDNSELASVMEFGFYQQDSYQQDSRLAPDPLVDLPTIPRTIYKYDKISRICSGSCPKFNQRFLLVHKIPTLQI